VLSRVSSRDPRVIVGPSVGRDAAVIDNGGRSDDVFVYAGGVTVHPIATLWLGSTMVGPKDSRV
jgi:hypothetical protein